MNEQLENTQRMMARIAAGEPLNGECEQIDAVTLAALERLASRLSEPLDLDGLVENLPVSRRTLYRLFQSDLGCSPGAALSELRLFRAAYLLEQTNQPICEIAFTVGFSSSQYMADVFRRRLKTTPSQCRRKTQQSNGDRQPG